MSVETVPVEEEGVEPVFAVPIKGATVFWVGGFLANMTRKGSGTF